MTYDSAGDGELGGYQWELAALDTTGQFLHKVFYTVGQAPEKPAGFEVSLNDNRALGVSLVALGVPAGSVLAGAPIDVTMLPKGFTELCIYAVALSTTPSPLVGELCAEGGCALRGQCGVRGGKVCVTRSVRELRACSSHLFCNT